MASKYVDISAIIQVIGNVYNHPELLDEQEKYIISENDFENEFHKVVFGSIYKLHMLGAQRITVQNINDFLSTRPVYETLYNNNKGEEWLQRASNHADYNSFDYYYNRVKKMSLLRELDNNGIAVSDLYDPDIVLDVKKRELQEEWLDTHSLTDIANIIDDKIETIKRNYVDCEYGEAVQAGDSIDELINSLIKNPEVGLPLYGPLINTVFRGARLKKFYLKSAPSGLGKSRTLLADAATIACNEIYDLDLGTWIKTNEGQPTLLINTELELSEVQTMLLAFLSGVNEEHILNGYYEGDEFSRVSKAAKIIKESPLYIEVIPDFSLKDIENTIKRNIKEHGIQYVFYDYIHSSMKILEEISSRSGGVRLREDNILFMLAIRLKDICNQYGIFLESATQLNGNYVDSDTYDQNLLRGAKSIADKIDAGSITLPVTNADRDGLVAIINRNGFDQPTIKISVYKNRRGKYKSIFLWCKADLGICRVEPMFATDYNYNLIQLNDTKIILDNKDENSAF